MAKQAGNGHDLAEAARPETTDIAEPQDRGRWLDPVAERLASGVDQAFRATGPVERSLRNALHGTWLGHPLHPVLTDVPLGAWTVAALLDLGRRPAHRAAADAAIGIGLLGAAGTALAGLADWHVLSGRARRTGVVHGLTNLGVAALYTASWMLRRRGARTAGRRLAFLAYGAAGVSAYLGGTLVFRHGVGTDHAPRASGAKRYRRVLTADALPDGAHARVRSGDTPLLLARRGDRITALADTCSHLGGPLGDGRIDEDSVTCPWHGSRFCLVTGKVFDGPATAPQPTYPTRVRDEWIEVALPDRPDDV